MFKTESEQKKKDKRKPTKPKSGFLMNDYYPNSFKSEHLKLFHKFNFKNHYPLIEELNSAVAKTQAKQIHRETQPKNKDKKSLLDYITMHLREALAGIDKLECFDIQTYRAIENSAREIRPEEESPYTETIYRLKKECNDIITYYIRAKNKLKKLPPEKTGPKSQEPINYLISKLIKIYETGTAYKPKINHIREPESYSGAVYDFIILIIYELLKPSKLNLGKYPTSKLAIGKIIQVILQKEEY